MTKNQIAAVVETLGFGAVIDVTEMVGGSSPSHRIHLAGDSSIVLKVYPEHQNKAPGQDAFASAQLAAIDVPITRFLLMDETRTRLPFRFAITNYLPGVTLGTLQHHPDIASAYLQTGALLRRLHDVPMPAYGDFGPDGIVEPAASNAAFMRKLIEPTFLQFAAHGADPALVARLRTIVEDGFDAVVHHSAGAVFAHDDLHPNNVLAVEGADGKLTLSGLIDFGNARAADPVFDLAKCLLCSEHEAPGITPYILDGYGVIEHPQPQTAFDYYTLIHRLVMWWWLRHVGILQTPDAPSDIMDELRRVAGG